MRPFFIFLVGSLLLSGCPSDICPQGDSSCQEPQPTPVPCHEAGAACSSDQWYDGWSESQNMEPGAACIQCHQGQGGPNFLIAGTVYSADLQPDGCEGARLVTITVTDANGIDYTMTSNTAGNFAMSNWDAPSFAMPYTATVEKNGKMKEMTTSQTNGDCNACHSGVCPRSAPGRIVFK